MSKNLYEQLRDKVDEILAFQHEKFRINIEPLSEQEWDNLITYIRKNGYILCDFDSRAKTADFEALW